MDDIVKRLEFGCPFKAYVKGVTEIGEKDAEAAERVMQEGAEVITSLRQQLAATQERIKELTQSDPCWYDMSEADAFRLWKEDRERMGRYQKALREIANPLGAIIAEADSKGCFVNGAMALAIANDPEHLKSIAQAALKE